jgi:DNA-binding MarR family transcriptional regulator
MTGPQRDLFHLLSYAENRAARRLAAAWDGEDCSIEQWRVLALLADGHGHPMTELADFALLPAPTATKLADRMVADTLIYRRADPNDRRRVLVYLTERGRELHTRLAASLDRLQDELMEAIGGARTDFEQRLTRLAEALDPAATRAPAPGKSRG